MIEFIYHAGIEKEIKTLERRHRNLKQGLRAFEKLCNVQFNPTNPQQVIAPSKLHRISHNNAWSMWKIELVIPQSNLRPSQYPRMWFVVKGSVIALLCISTHIDNYNDNAVTAVALGRVSDIF